MPRHSGLSTEPRRRGRFRPPRVRSAYQQRAPRRRWALTTQFSVSPLHCVCQAAAHPRTLSWRVALVLVLGPDVLVGLLVVVAAAGVVGVGLDGLHALEILVAAVDGVTGKRLVLLGLHGVPVGAARGQQRLLGVGTELLALAPR